MAAEVDSDEIISKVLYKAKEQGFYTTSKFLLMKKTADKLVRDEKYIFLEKKRGPDNKIEYLGEYKGPVKSVVVDTKRKIAKVQFEGGEQERFDGSAEFVSYPDYLGIRTIYPPEEGNELPVVRNIPGKLYTGPHVPRDIEVRSNENPGSELSADSVQRRRPHPVRLKQGEALNPSVRDIQPVDERVAEPVAENVAKKLNRTSRKRSPSTKVKYNRRSGSYCRPRTRRCTATGQCVSMVTKPAGQKRCPRGSGQRRCADQVCYPVS